LLANKQMVLTNSASFVMDNRSMNAWSSSRGLFTELAGRASTWVNNLAGRGVKFLVGNACR
jgi:hypothetical protein